MNQSESDQLKKQVKKWADAKGAKEAQLRLIRNGLSFSIAYQLSIGKYVSDLKVQRVIDAIQKTIK